MNIDELCKIRDQVGALCTRGTISSQVKMGIFKKTFGEIKQVLSRGTVMCHGAAYALEMKYKELGLVAYNIAFKTPDMSHVVTLVGDDLILMDATFNLHYGNGMSIFDVITDVRSGKEIKTVSSPFQVEYVQMLIDPIEKHPYKTNELIREEADRKVYKAIITVDRFEKFFDLKLNDIYKGKLLYVRSGLRAIPEIENRIKGHIKSCG